jgi:Mg2+-importing ATPase
MESIATQTLVVFAMRTDKPLWKSKPGKWLLFSCIAVVLAAFIIPFTPLGVLFGFTGVPIYFFGILIVLVLTYILIIEAAKRIFFRTNSN